MWVVSSEHKTDDGGNAAIELSDEDGSFRANVRWDGCMQVWIHSTTEEGNEQIDTLHTCDLNSLIEKLQELKQACCGRFDNRGYWEAEVERVNEV
jgi:hypothetical protein